MALTFSQGDTHFKAITAGTEPSTPLVRLDASALEFTGGGKIAPSGSALVFTGACGFSTATFSGLAEFDTIKASGLARFSGLAGSATAAALQVGASGSNAVEVTSSATIGAGFYFKYTSTSGSGYGIYNDVHSDGSGGSVAGARFITRLDAVGGKCSGSGMHCSLNAERGTGADNASLPAVRAELNIDSAWAQGTSKLYPLLAVNHAEITLTNSVPTAVDWTTGQAYTTATYLTSGYKCKSNHTSSGTNKPGTAGGATYWEVFAGAKAVWTRFVDRETIGSADGTHTLPGVFWLESLNPATAIIPLYSTAGVVQGLRTTINWAAQAAASAAYDVTKVYNVSDVVVGTGDVSFVCIYQYTAADAAADYAPTTGGSWATRWRQQNAIPEDYYIPIVKSTQIGSVVPQLATTSLPTAPTEGAMFYDLTAHKLKVWNGSAYETVSSST